MKPIIIFLSILLISTATASPSLTFQHNQTQPCETILATITASEFTKQIDQSDITFYEGRKQTPFESDVTFYNGTHYLYIYTTREGNFSLQIANILYKESDQLKSITLEQSFNIKTNLITDEETSETSTEILSIKPGFIFSYQQPKIKLINKGTATLNLTYNEIELSIKPLTTQEITFTPTQTFSYFKLSSYKEFSIPVIYLTANPNTTFVSPSIKSDLRSETELILTELFTTNKTQIQVKLFNFGDQNLTDITVTSNTSFIEIEHLENIPPRGTQNLTLVFEPTIPGHFQDYINITYMQNETQYKLAIPMSIFVLPKGTPQENFEVKEETCDEIGGVVCEVEEERCNGTTFFTKNIEYCCLSTCVTIENEGSEEGGYGWLIGILIFAILGIAGYYFYNKQKKLVPTKPEDKLKEVSNKFEQRMKNPETKQITKSLTKS